MKKPFLTTLCASALLTFSCQNTSNPPADLNEAKRSTETATDNTAVELPADKAVAPSESRAAEATGLGSTVSPPKEKAEKKETKKTPENALAVSEPNPTGKDKPTEPKPAGEAAKPTSEPKPAKPDDGPPSHAAWDNLLRQYVAADGKVNYEGMKRNQSKLDAYLKTLQENPPKDGWSKGEKMAFWINAYNAATVQLIVDNYPLSSITKLDGGKPWDVKRVKIGGTTYSLNNIEHDILRPQFKDPRIHFALNCAAVSCPPLLNRAWTASNLENNFEQQAKSFINNSRFNKISAKSAQVSKLFDWYGSDFGDLIGYLNKYADTPIKKGVKPSFLEYDWALNKQ